MSERDPAAGSPHPLPARSGEPAAEVAVGDQVLIPLVEERARIDKRSVETGRVRVSTRTDTVEQVLRESLLGNSVGVTRVPVGRTLAEGEAAPVTRVEDGVTIIPVLEEVLVVAKRLVLREEVHVRETATSEQTEVPITLRRQRAVVERVGADGAVTEIEEPTSEETKT